MHSQQRVRIACLVSLAVLILVGCSPAATPQSASIAREPAAAPTAAPKVIMAPEPTAAPAADAQARTGNANASPNRSTRMIIKNGEMRLLVNSTDSAIEQVTDSAVNSGGYIVSSRVTLVGAYKNARMTMGVPVDQFEAVMRQLRALAVKVISENASGQDVSDEFVDLQSRVGNLEATAARIREFLKDTKTVEEALKVNSELSAVEDEIEKIKGRMQYLKDRAAYSTIVVDIEEVQPTPTPTPTATPTPTPTPVVWQPIKTAEKAADTLGDLLKSLIEALIWVVIVVLPCLLPLAAVVALVVYLRRRSMQRKDKGSPPA